MKPLNIPLIHDFFQNISVNHVFENKIVQKLIHDRTLGIYLAESITKTKDELPEFLQKVSKFEMTEDKDTKELNERKWLPAGHGMVIIDHDRQQVLSICAGYGVRIPYPIFHSSLVTKNLDENPEMWKAFKSLDWMAQRKLDSKEGSQSLIQYEEQRINWESAAEYEAIKPGNAIRFLTRELEQQCPNVTNCDGQYMLHNRWTMFPQYEGWDFSKCLDGSCSPEKWKEQLPEMLEVFAHSKVSTEYWEKWLEELEHTDVRFIYEGPLDKEAWLAMNQDKIPSLMKGLLLDRDLNKTLVSSDSFVVTNKPHLSHRF